MLGEFIKSVVDMDEMPVVICNLEHIIVYMNPAAIKRYKKRGGGNLIGKSLLNCHNKESCVKIKDVTQWFMKSQSNNKVFTFHRKDENYDYDVYMIALRNEIGELIGYYEKHESRIHETMTAYDLR